MKCSNKQPLKLNVNGNLISMVKTTVCLEVRMDEGFSLYRHVQLFEATARNFMHGLRIFPGNLRGFSFHGMRKIYKAVYEGMLTYAAPIWSHTWEKKKYKKK